MLLEHDPVYYKTKDTGSVNHKNTGCRKKKKKTRKGRQMIQVWTLNP